MDARKLFKVFIIIAVCGTLTEAVRAEQSGSVNLHIDTGSKPAVTGTPVSGGVPFPMGVVATTDHLRLKNSQSNEVPANYRLLAAWPDGSVKSALISFVPTPQNATYDALTLDYGPLVTHLATGPVQLTQDSQTITITNGLLKLQLSKQRFSVLEQVWTDLNSDGSFTPDEQWLNGPADLVVVDNKTGNSFRSSLWSAADGYAPRLVEAGPQRVTVLLDGRVKGVSGALTADGDATLLEAKVWLSVYAGSSVVSVQTTLIDTKARNTETFSSYVMELKGVSLDLPTTLTQTSYAAGGENGAIYQGQVNAQAVLLQDATSTFNSGSFSYTFTYSGVGSGAQAPGWMDTSTSSRGLMMGLRHFWQSFPHKLTANGSGLFRLEFLPTDSPNTFWTVFPGVAKTYEGFLDFHTGSFTPTVQQRAELALRQPLLVADPSWYASTQALGPISPADTLSAHWETQMASQYACTVLRQGCSIYPQVYGQRNFGDYIVGYGTRSDGSTFPEFGDEHYEDPHAFLVQFARTGDRKWFDYAVPGARHHYDLDVTHTQNPVRYPGFPAGKINWHGSSEHEGANIEMGHAVPGGLDEYYLLTGDPRALEVAKEQGDWMDAWARAGSGRIAPEFPGDGLGYEEYERVGAWTLYTLLKTYEITGDPKYWEGASILVKNTIDWWKMPQEHIVFDPNRQLNLTQPPENQALYLQQSDWTQGTGYPLPTLRVANCQQTSAPLQNYAYQTHAPIGWMSGLLQTSLIRYYQDLDRLGGVYSGNIMYRGQSTTVNIDTATMREMLIQILNMVVDHVYTGAPKYPSKYPWLSGYTDNLFVYSVCPEWTHTLEDGGEYLQWPLAFISSFNQSDVSSRWQTIWPQLQAKWREIAQIQYSRLIVNHPGPWTGYNGTPTMWNMPFAIAKMETLGLLNNLPPPPTSTPSTSTTTSSSTTSSTSTTVSSIPPYQVTVNDGNPFITNSLVDIVFVAPSQAVQVNVSTTGFGQGTWQQTSAGVHGFQLPGGAGTKTLYIQFRDSTGTVLASVKKSVILLQPGFTGSVSLVLNEPTDTYVFSNDANSNFGAQSIFTAGKYDVGYDNIALLNFKIPALPAGVTVTVQGATLGTYLIENTRNTSQAIAPYEPTASWNEDTVTWNTRPVLSSTAMGNSLTFTGRSEVNQWKTFTLDPAVIQRWIQNPTSVNGLALVGDPALGLTSVQMVSSESFSPSGDFRPQLTLTLNVSSTDTTPPVISNLQAVNVGEVATTIQWATDKLADGLVEYGTTTAYGQTAPAQMTLSTTHAITLQGLTGRTAYHARVTSKDAAANQTVSGDLAFTTTGPLPGDINHDGVINLSDLTLLLGQLLGISTVTPETADVNADGRVDIGDLQALVNRL